MIFPCNIMEPFLLILTTFAEYKISAMNLCNKIFSNQSDTRKVYLINYKSVGLVILIS